MCPDRQILSAFADGEVPSPWSEKVRKHLESCESCSRIVRVHRSVSDRLAETAGPDPESARKAVWARLVDSDRRRSVPLWRARFAVPLPVAAAAMLAFAVLSTLVVTSRRENSALRLAIFAASELTPSVNQASAMESVLQFLESQDSRITVTVQLPPGAGLESFGKPVFMKAPDLAPMIQEVGK